MREVRALLVDDERLARTEMRRLLEAHDRVEIVGEAENLARAEEAIRSHQPDLVFLDIQMPDGSGFDLLARLDAVPQVIFTTAHDDFAIRAFEVNALDYLLKPVDPARLREALDRLPERPAEPATHSPGRALGPGDRVFVRDGDECWFLRLGDVHIFEADGSGTLLHLADRTVRSHRALSHLEARLDPGRFFRANRQQIVGVGFIEGLDDLFKGQMVLRLTDGTTVVLSRRRARAFRDTMSL